MKQYLDLTQEELSDIKYKISKFPDGQQSVKITSGFSREAITVIKSRFNSFQDLELILCATKALKNVGIKEIELFIPYFLGARSDRKFGYGDVHYVKDIMAPIINNQGYTQVTVFDPHSDVIEACINNFEKISNINLVRMALTNIDNKNGAQSRIALVSPDAGALKKIYDVAKEFKIQNVITANKVRNVLTGEILRTELPPVDWEGIESVVIVDDICDGGRTFVELAKAIRETGYKEHLYLIVSHGIFSAGLDVLREHFTKVYCTNSIKNISDPLIKHYNVLA